MGGGVRRESAQRLLALALGADLASAAGLVSEDDRVDEALKEIALPRRSCPPGRLECLVRLEPAAGVSEPEPPLVFARDGVIVGASHGDDPARWGRPLSAREAR